LVFTVSYFHLRVARSICVSPIPILSQNTLPWSNRHHELNVHPQLPKYGNSHIPSFFAHDLIFWKPLNVRPWSPIQEREVGEEHRFLARFLASHVSSSSVELPGEVARLLSDMREENQALWRAVKQLGGRIPPHIASTLGSSGNSHSHSQSLSLPSSQGQHTITHSRSSSNLGDDTDRDVDWEDDEPGSGGPGGGSSGTDAFGGLNMHTTIGAPSPLSLAGPSPSLHSHSPSLHAHSPSPHPPSPSEEWRRWAETEISRERRRVDKLVNVVRAFVEHVNVSPGAGPGQGGGHGTNVGTGKGGEGGEEGKSSSTSHTLTTNGLV